MSTSEPTFTQNSPSPDIRALTGVRGVGALLIVIYHFGKFRPDFMRESWAFPHGYMAVDLFFMLSGYVIALNYSESMRSGVAAYRGYLVRRFARIYPAYALISLFYVWRLAMGWGGDETLARFSTYDTIGNVLLLTGWGLSVYPLIGVAWAASAEFGSYFLTPLLMFGVLWRSPLVWCGSVVLAAAAIYIVGTSGTGYSGPLDVVDVRSILPLVRTVAGFTFGLALFRYADWLNAIPGRVQDMLLILVLALILLAALLLKDDFVIYGLFIALVALLSRDGRLAQLLFANPLVYHFGVISYSIYLLHSWFFRPIALLTRYFGATKLAHQLSALFFFAIIWLLSYLIWRFVEEPGRHWVTRVLLPRRPVVRATA